MSEDTGSGPEEPALPSYAGPVQRRKFKRIRLGLLMSSMAACLGVTLLGVTFGQVAMLAMGITGAAMNYGLLSSNGFFSGVYGAFQLATYNFLLFFITVPAAWLALGLSIGRFPYRGILKRAPYIRWGAIWGAILVGGTTGGFGLISSVLSGLGALIAGGAIGAIAGSGCGLLFHAIVKPANQLSDVDVGVF